MVRDWGQRGAVRSERVYGLCHLYTLRVWMGLSHLRDTLHLTAQAPCPWAIHPSPHNICRSLGAERILDFGEEHGAGCSVTGKQEPAVWMGRPPGPTSGDTLGRSHALRELQEGSRQTSPFRQTPAQLHTESQDGSCEGAGETRETRTSCLEGTVPGPTPGTRWEDTAVLKEAAREADGPPTHQTLPRLPAPARAAL